MTEFTSKLEIGTETEMRYVNELRLTVLDVVYVLIIHITAIAFRLSVHRFFWVIPRHGAELSHP